MSASHICLLNVRLEPQHFFLCRWEKLISYPSLHPNFIIGLRAHENFLKPMDTCEGKRWCLETSFMWSCCCLQFELNTKEEVLTPMRLQQEVPGMFTEQQLCYVQRLRHKCKVAVSGLNKCFCILISLRLLEGLKWVFKVGSYPLRLKAAVMSEGVS